MLRLQRLQNLRLQEKLNNPAPVVKLENTSDLSSDASA